MKKLTRVKLIEKKKIIGRHLMLVSVFSANIVHPTVEIEIETIENESRRFKVKYRSNSKQEAANRVGTSKSTELVPQL